MLDKQPADRVDGQRAAELGGQPVEARDAARCVGRRVGRRLAAGDEPVALDRRTGEAGQGDGRGAGCRVEHEGRRVLVVGGLGTGWNARRGARGSRSADARTDAEQRRADDLPAHDDRDRQAASHDRTQSIERELHRPGVGLGLQPIRQTEWRRAGGRPQRRRQVRARAHVDRDPARAGCLHETPRKHVGDLGRGPRGGKVVDGRCENPGPAVIDEGGRGLERRREVVAHRSLGPFATVEDHEANHERDAAGDPIEDRADGLGRDPRREQERVEAPGQARRDHTAQHPAHDRRNQHGGEREHEVRVAGDVLAQADLQEEGPHGERHGERHAGNPLAPDPAGSQPPELVRGPCSRVRRRDGARARSGHRSDSGSTSTDHGASRPPSSSATGSVPRRTTFQRQRSARRAM